MSEFVFRLHENAWTHLEWDGPSTAIAASLDEETRPADNRTRETQRAEPDTAVNGTKVHTPK